jgi:membrane protease YdiL (CAAX protease family)
MKRIIIGLLWLAAFVSTGAAFGKHFIPPYMPVRPILGMLMGLLIFFPLAAVGWLPGAGPKRGAPVEWGWKQAVWLVIQFFALQAVAQVLLLVLVLAAWLTALRLGRHPAPLGLGGGPMLMGRLAPDLAYGTAAGYLTAALWSVWYIGRLGPARLRDGAATGIAWCPAPRVAYLWAVGGLAVVGLVNVVVQRLLPPSRLGASENPIMVIFTGHVWLLFLLAAVIAPFLEELVFRGGMIAALSPRLGAVWAAAITSAVFTACHAQEGWAYPPGMLVILTVAIILAWLRLRYRSIRPGILLHVLFNGAGVLAMALTR